ncbi:1-acyl-sn-glycerol-3-phosphate acyltransferase [Frondihabitans sp. PhB188]|uniref:lysophospholipid acyltransferase family protein n=1 Tax=Frondihabitans sp. PhB188 TaxID=2485200 RepID=UPI000F961678|nr:lysophospholipid acyltransferase family protein [Frondihabitans sp. PhB188]ROQ38358.1 1-acyl-sn-glycerol-3-phosphate acyltransferase [Frondihabitans sp. PhB188]
MYRFLRFFVVRPVMFAFFRVRVSGLSNIPKRGGVILAGNHIAFIDSVFVPAVVLRPMTYLTASDYFTKTGLGGRLLGWFLTQIGQLPIDRAGGSAAKASLQTGLGVLASGGALGIYPEGSRSRDGSLHRGRTGVARMVLSSGVPIVPFGIQGSDQVMVKGSKLPRRARVTVVFGEPIHFEKVEGDYDATRLRAVTDEVMAAIAALTPQEYVDSYSTGRGA